MGKRKNSFITKSGLGFWWPLLIVLLFLLFMEIRGTLGNWGTISIVAVTMIYVMLIHKSILNTSILRRQDRVLDFKRGQLYRIVNWAKEVPKQLLIFRSFDPLSRSFGSGMREALQVCAIENDWLIWIAGMFGEEFQKIVEKGAKDLWAYIDALTTTTIEHKPIDHALYIRALNQSFTKVVKNAWKVEAYLVETSLE